MITTTKLILFFHSFRFEFVYWVKQKFSLVTSSYNH